VRFGEKSASLGVDWMKVPSVTGRKPQEPKMPEADTRAEARWSVSVF
jgi:hypothetical protein